jgi:hypothetical protein
MMKPAQKIDLNATLTSTVAKAVVDALAAGLSAADVAAVLTRAAELLEEED